MTDARSTQQDHTTDATVPPDPPELTEASREGEEDSDTLTYNEVAIRLHLEVRNEEAKLEGASTTETPAIQARIAALRQAAQRNTPRAEHDHTFEHLFGFTPVHQPLEP
jgi:hypothetical protein